MSENVNLVLITKEAGVHDLPLKVRVELARALQAERSGDDAAAFQHLTLALEAEEKLGAV